MDKNAKNKWQKAYCDIYFKGKSPRTKQGKIDMDLLSKVKSIVTVQFPDFTGINGFVPAHTETYTITEKECDMPNGKISVGVLVSNLSLWLSRGYKVTTR